MSNHDPVSFEPFAYLSDVLRRLPSTKTGAGVRALLPDVWKPL